MPPSRVINRREVLGRSVSPTGVVTEATGLVYQENSTLLVGSQGHYGYPHFPPNSDIGGSFALQQSITSKTGGSVALQNSLGSKSYYSGNIVGEFVQPSGVYTPPSGDASAFAVDAFNRMKPTRPSFQGVTSILELRDLPGMFKLDLEQNFLKFQGNYFLAIKFGWEPLLRDIRNLVNAQRNAQKRLAQLIRDNGKSVRRNIKMADSNETVGEFSGSLAGIQLPVLATSFQRKNPTYRITHRKTDRVWGSASFKYWLPPGPRDIVWRRKMLAAIYGLYPSPSQIYNAVPWTWLIDWFGGIGNALENLESGVAERLAASHFYMMRETSDILEIWSRGYYYAKGTGAPQDVDAFCSRYLTRKTRVRGDPFGWQTTQASLSPTQLAILGALGLSKIG